LSTKKQRNSVIRRKSFPFDRLVLYGKSIYHYTMNGQNRSDIKPGLKVAIVLKKDQRSGTLTKGVVADLLTNSSFHPHGIKVRLTDGQVGRVQEIYP
jgi:uncharacterized repeat protein (TIGR03833 family)